ncbi:MAG TPA: 16S rRNA (cytosine(967)-C(5))-methyltransferase RsmB [Smithella sp.]|nr:16S rRNA (cytosine(967)-C(5))-methyltransferase RsmB [Smithella sp.]
MKKTVRHLAVEILNRLESSDAFAGELLDEYLERHCLSETPDGRLLTHLVYGVLRLRGHLDWILARLCRGGLENMDEGIKNILRLGLFQLKFSDRLPDFAVVNEAVKIAGRLQPEKRALVNAVLRNYLRRGDEISFPSPKKNPASFLATYHAHPLWLVKKWLKIFGFEETAALCAANNEIPPLTIRVNTLKISRENFLRRLGDAGWDARETTYSPDGLILNHPATPVQKSTFFEKGLVRLQDEGAQLLSRMAHDDRTETVLDACAGTGGKTTHLAALLRNRGKIVAVDRSTEKLDELRREANRLGINIIETQILDLSETAPSFLRSKFDCVLVDAPCSGTGTLRRNPEIKWRLTEKDLRKLVTSQKTILQNASATVKKGGRLLYGTCSLLPEENEKIVDDFLKSNADFSMGEPPASIDKRLLDSRGSLRTYPQRHNMDGFFAAILKRQ